MIELINSGGVGAPQSLIFPRITNVRNENTAGNIIGNGTIYKTN
jgi:hypothetical protein